MNSAQDDIRHRNAPGSPSGEPVEGEAAAGRWVLVATVLGSSMAFIDGTVVNVALPALQNYFHASGTDVQWVIESFALFLAALILVGGSMGDHFGRKRIFVLATILFALASVWCGLAQSIRMLIIARAVQGVGAAMLIPSSLALLSSSFPEETRGKAIGTWSGFSALTAAVGPLLGGLLVQHSSWRWVFFLNIPFAVAVVVICSFRVRETALESTLVALDWGGAVLATLGLSAITYALIEFSSGLPALLLGIGGLICLALFAWLEWRLGERAMVPLALFRSHNFTGTNLLTLLLYGSISGLFFYQPLNLIQVQRYSPQAAGAALLPVILLIFLLSRWAGSLAQRYGPRLPLVSGSLVTAAGYALLIRPSVGGSYWTTFFPGQVAIGLGLSLTVAPLTTTVMNAVSKENAGVASGVNNAVSRVSSLLAIAVFGVLFQNSFSARLKDGLPHTGLSPAAQAQVYAQRGSLAALDAPTPAVRNLVDAAFVTGFRRMAASAALLAVISALATFWTVQDANQREGD